MSNPAKLSHPELAVVILFKLFLVAVVLMLVVFLVLPDYVKYVAYGLAVFFINNLVFAFYVFRSSRLQPPFGLASGFLRGTFFKLVFFALSLLFIYRLDGQSINYDKSAAFFAGYFLLQFFQIVFSVFEARKL